MPYVYCEPESYDDQVFLFHKEEDAKKLVEDYRQHENPIVAVKLENKQFLGFYSSLFMMGVNGDVYKRQAFISAGRARAWIRKKRWLTVWLTFVS